MWLFDALIGKKNRLAELERIVFHGREPSGKYSESSLLSIANAQASDGMRILGDCTRVIQTTHDPNTFYYHLRLFEETAQHLHELEPYVKFSGTTPTEILAALERDREEIILDFESRPGAMYYANVEKIEAQWSVLTNLKIFTGAQADAFESLCKQNISEFYEMVGYNKEQSPGYVMPSRVPAYTRIAMLYEKQKKYQKAIEICVDAIRNGAVDDGSKGKMYGRLARMIRKSGVEVSEDIKRLAVANI